MRQLTQEETDSKIEKIAATSPEKPSQFIAWHKDIPYLAKLTPHGVGFFHHIEFKVGDTDFKNTLADETREFFVDPSELALAGWPSVTLNRSSMRRRGGKRTVS